MIKDVIVESTKRNRGKFGKLMWRVFLAFNVVMTAWFISFLYNLTKIKEAIGEIGQQTSFVVGQTIATSIILSTWVTGSALLVLVVLISKRWG